MTAPGVIVVTGAGGYIGRRLVEMLRRDGRPTRTLGRRGDVEWSLDQPVPDGALDDAAAVIHLAHQWNSGGEPENDVNLRGGMALLEASRAAGVSRFVLGSTVSARPDALNRYGRLKARLEAGLNGPAEVAARIGLVYGGAGLSQWGTLLKITRLPVLPMLDPGVQVQPIHLDEVCRGLIRLADGDGRESPVHVLAGPEPVSFGAFLKAVARHRHGKALPILPIPSSFALAMVDLASRVPGLPRIDRERILGIQGLPVLDSRHSMAALGLRVRTLVEGLAPEPWHDRRRLVTEGHVLTTAILGKPPRAGAIRRYVRGVQRFEGGAPVALPPLVQRLPALMAAFEPVGGGESPLGRRLALAMRVVEAEPAGNAMTHDSRGLGPAGAILRLGLTGLREGVLLPLRLVLGRRR